jgi:hypothetical protein
VLALDTGRQSRVFATVTGAVVDAFPKQAPDGVLVRECGDSFGLLQEATSWTSRLKAGYVFLASLLAE